MILKCSVKYIKVLYLNQNEFLTAGNKDVSRKLFLHHQNLEIASLWCFHTSKESQGLSM